MNEAPRSAEVDVMIRSEEDRDQQAIWQVNRAAFETQAEATLVDALRDGNSFCSGMPWLPES